MMEEDKLLNEHQVAELLGQDVQTLRNNRWKGVGCPYIKLGRSVRYRLDDVREHVAANRIVPSEAA